MGSETSNTGSRFLRAQRALTGDALEPLVAAISVALSGGVAWYWTYRGQCHPEAFLEAAVYRGLPMLLVLLTFNGLAMALVISRLVDGFRRRQPIRVVVRCVALILLGVSTAWHIPRQPGYISFTEGLRAWAASAADIGAIASWVQHVGGAYDGVIPEREWPPAVSDLASHDVSLRRCAGGPSVLRIAWGSGFGHFGLDVAPAGLDTAGLADGEYVQWVESRAYVWHEVQ